MTRPAARLYSPSARDIYVTTYSLTPSHWSRNPNSNCIKYPAVINPQLFPIHTLHQGCLTLTTRYCRGGPRIARFKKPQFPCYLRKLLNSILVASFLPGMKLLSVPIHLVFLVAWPLILHQAIAESCYWPSRQLADNYLPCPNSKACCATGEACLSNGLCYGAYFNIAYRGACTDKSWPEPSCPRVCHEGKSATKGPSTTSLMVKLS